MNESEQSALQAAQSRLAAVALKMPLNPASAAISAYINSLLQSARIEGVLDWLNHSMGEQTLDQAIAAALERKADELEKQIAALATQIQVPGAIGNILRPS